MIANTLFWGWVFACRETFPRIQGEGAPGSDLKNLPSRRRASSRFSMLAVNALLSIWIIGQGIRGHSVSAMLLRDASRPGVYLMVVFDMSAICTSSPETA